MSERSTAVRCPACAGTNLRPSRRQVWLDGIMKWIGRKPLRCRTCGCRFYGRLPVAEGLDTKPAVRLS